MVAPSKTNSGDVPPIPPCLPALCNMSRLLGAHMSVAGGLPRAVERAVAHRCDAFQIFTKNASRWLNLSTLRSLIAESPRDV